MNPSFLGPCPDGRQQGIAVGRLAHLGSKTGWWLGLWLCLVTSAASLCAANNPPTIGTISNYTVFIDQPTLPIDMVIADAETPKTNLLLSAVSSDQNVVPDGNIFFGTLGGSRYLTVTPAFGATGSANITVTVSDATNAVSTNFNFMVLAPPAGSARFANTNVITIPNSGVASNYPSTIEVMGLTGAVVNVALTLSRLEHEFPEDMRMLLVGPGGQGALFFAHVGGGRSITNVTITVTDSSPFPLPDEFLLISEPLRPGNYGTNNTLPAPAPSGPFGTNMASFNGSAPSGTWSLYIVDDISPDHGMLAGGWSILIAAAEGPLPPTISDIPNRVTTSGVPTPVIPFTIGDPDTLASNLVVSGYASNPILVPTNAIVFGGSGSNRTVRITPAVGQSGVTTITVMVSDGTNSASDSFDLTVNVANTPPVISGVADQSINEDTVLGPIAFTVTDAELPAGSLVVSGGASNPGLVPTNNFLFGKGGSNRTVTLAPAANSNGTTIITLSVSDGTLFTTTNFTLTVNAVNDRPTISHMPNRLTTTNFPTPALPLTITDVDTPLGSLTLTADSSNPALVPTNNIVFGGSGGNRTVTITPAGGLTGTSTITLTVSDGALSTNDSFVLTVIPSNSPPVISSIANQTIDEDTNTGPIAFTIGDAETGAGSLVLSRGSSNPNLVPTNNIIISGGASNRTVIVTPLANQNGTAIITVSVEDGQYLVMTNFLLTVNPVDDRPTISAITNRVISVNSTAGPIFFVVGDLESAAGNLTVTASSSDQTLLPDANITLGGSDSNRTITLVPAANEVGITTITVNVSDGELSTNRTFLLTVTPPNTAPTIGAMANQTVYLDQPTLAIALPINDAETPRVNLMMTGASSDTNLVPVQNIFFGTFAPNQYITVTPALGQLGTATITVNVSDGTNSASTNFLITVTPPPPGAARFANETPITIPNVGTASPYPSEINVSGMIGTVTNLEVTLSRINHEFVTDLEMLLVSPSGQGVVVFSHVAQGHSASNVTVTLSDRSPFTLPQSFFLWSEPLKPTDWGSTNQFPAPAPAGPYGAVAMSTFNGLAANGTWSLYVYDDFSPDHGAISGGWSLMVATTGGSGGAPFISNLTNQSTVVNTATAAIPFTIGDDSTPANNLVLTASSSNPTLLPTNNIVFGGSESNRTVTLTPAPNTLGSATVTVSVSDGSFTSLDTFVLTVNPAPLTINVDSTNRSYGATNPVFTGSLIGLQPGAGITATFTSMATTNSAVGTYAIVPSLSDPNGRLGNYAMTTNQGTLTVTTSPLTVTAASTNRSYGVTNPVFTGSLNGLRNNDNITATFTSAATTNSPVGSYSIGALLSDPGNRLGNYTVTTNSGTLVVTAAGLLITVNSTNRVYGATNPVFNGALTGLRNNDNITATFSSAATTNSPAGNYPIVASLADPGGRLGNYTVTTNGGTLTVTATESTNSLVSSLNPSPAGTNITFTATVARAGLGAGQPTGSIQFLTNGVAAGPAVALAGGVASASNTNLPVGTNLVQAAYAGDGNFLGSTSSLFQVVIASQPADPPVVIGILNNGDGTATIRFGGTPGVPYKVEATTNLVPPIAWTILSTNTPGANGEWTISAQTTEAIQRFYRAGVP